MTNHKYGPCDMQLFRADRTVITKADGITIVAVLVGDPENPLTRKIAQAVCEALDKVEAQTKPISRYMAALTEYRNAIGYNWKAQLIKDWFSDARSQWGLLRSLRNDPAFGSFDAIFKAYDAEAGL